MTPGRYDVTDSRGLLWRALVGGCLTLLCACSSSEPKEQDDDVPVTQKVKLRTKDEGPPLGNPRDTVSPPELLEGVDRD